MKYSLQILKNKNLFKRLKYPSPNALNIKYFSTLSYNYWEFLENGMPKKRLDTALYTENQLKYFALSNLPNFFN